MDFHDRLRKLMAARGDNNSTLAKNAGIPYTTIDGLFKKGYKNAYVSTMQKLSTYYGVTLDYLLNGDDTASAAAITLAAKFDQLDSYGKDAVSAIVDAEYRRCTESGSITTAVQHAVRNGETEDSIATVITLYSRAGEDARSKALDVLADDDGRGFKAENDAVLGRHVGQIIGKDANAAKVE